MALNDVYEVKIFCSMPRQTGLNVRHYKVTASVAPEPPASAFMDFLDQQFAAQYPPLLNTTAFYHGVSVQKILPLPKSVAITTDARRASGTGGSDPMPKQVSGVITLRTLLAGRRNRGRVFVPFPSEQSNTLEGVPTGLYGLSLIILGDFLIQPVNIVGLPGSATYTPVLNHRTPPFGQEILVSRVARGIWGTQRRRGDYGSPNIDVDL